MKKICSVLATLTLIFGLIGAFILAKDLGMPNLFDTERNWGVTIGVFIGIACSAVVLSVILFALSQILENQEYIISTSKQVSPTLLGSLEKEAEKKEVMSFGGWECPKCGTLNRSHTGTCKCGQKKIEVKD